MIILLSILAALEFLGLLFLFVVSKRAYSAGKIDAYRETTDEIQRILEMADESAK